MGNPTTYRGKTLTWRGKQMTGITAGMDVISYSYDENGLRLQKTVNNVATDYYYNGKVLIGLTKGTDTLRFSYDAAGNAAAVDHNGTYYYYLRNGQGDIVKIIDGSGSAVVEYTYDSWGKPLSCTGTLATTLGALNPFRYRGYVYDEETGFYYLKSRYYDPETCRFVSADVLLSTGQGLLGHNCYAYCLNNPLMLTDSTGHSGDKYRTWNETWTGSESHDQRKPDKYFMNEEYPDINEYITAYIPVLTVSARAECGASAAMGHSFSPVDDLDGFSTSFGGGTLGIGGGFSIAFIPERDVHIIAEGNYVVIGGSIGGLFTAGYDLICYYNDKGEYVSVPTISISIGYSAVPFEFHGEYGV